MMEFWQEALKIGGIATIGAYVFYRLAKDVLHISWLEELTAQQKLTFLIVFIAAIVFVSVRLIDSNTAIMTSVKMDRKTGQFKVDSSSLTPEAQNSILRQAISDDLYSLGNSLFHKHRFEEAVSILRSSEKLSGRVKRITLKRIKTEVELYKTRGVAPESISRTHWNEANEIIKSPVVSASEENLELSIQILELAKEVAPAVSQEAAQLKATLSFNRAVLDHTLTNNKGIERAFDNLLQSADRHFFKGNYVEAISRYAHLVNSSDDLYPLAQINRAIELYTASLHS